MVERIAHQDMLDALNNITYLPNDIVRLRQRYRDSIASTRTAERIRTLPDLVKILRKRDELSAELVSDIIRELEPNPHINCPSFTNHHQHRPMRPVFDALPDTINDRIFQIVSEDIGHKWKELARALKIKEGQIDDLEACYASISERVLQFLRYHHEVCDRRMWRTELVQALSKARRNDLGKKVSYEFDIRC